jgi:hypothetical protein
VRDDARRGSRGDTGGRHAVTLGRWRCACRERGMSAESPRRRHSAQVIQITV